MSTKSHGDVGEDYAVEILVSKGYKIVDRKFRSKFGEIDIIAKDKDTLVFVEVKTRWSKKYGKPEEAVTPRKLLKIKRAIDYYLMKNRLSDKDIRIEVVAIDMTENILKIIQVN